MIKNYFGKEFKYGLGSYNKFNEIEQWIRITEGCPWNHSFCYEPTKIRIFGIPKIVRNKIKIMDMNLLCKSKALKIIEELGKKKVKNKVVYYELICGIDFRFLTQKIANALKNSRFKNIRIAWDFWMTDQYKIKDSIKMLLKAGYKAKEIMIFMICNWDIPFSECCRKLDLCKIWNVRVADCYYDNQTSPKIIPIKWTKEQIKDFRRKCRKHNQLVSFEIDPDVKAKQESLL